MKNNLTRGTFIIIALIFVLAACATPYSYYISGYGQNRRILEDLFRELHKKELRTDNYMSRFALITEIFKRMETDHNYEKRTAFLTQYVHRNPMDPYNSYYLYLAAELHRENDALPLAEHYYQRIIAGHPDVKFQGKSIHFSCYLQLLKNTENWDLKIDYYKQIISRFSDYVDVGLYYYYLAEAYEKVGRGDLSIQTFKKFLNYPGTAIMEHPDAYTAVKEKIEFYQAEKDWLVEDLNVLVDTVRRALREKNIVLLNTYKADVNFFAKFRTQNQTYGERTEKVFNIANFLYISNVRVSSTLEQESNAQEAYLRTTGWAYWLNTWYFYFRRVNFPEDPEIDGKWEWAGIYFGERN